MSFYAPDMKCGQAFSSDQSARDSVWNCGDLDILCSSDTSSAKFTFILQAILRPGH